MANLMHLTGFGPRSLNERPCAGPARLAGFGATTLLGAAVCAPFLFLFLLLFFPFFLLFERWFFSTAIATVNMSKVNLWWIIFQIGPSGAVLDGLLKLMEVLLLTTKFCPYTWQRYL